MIAIGAVVAAFALEALLVPCTILDGGVTGISIILNQLTGISLSAFVFVLNIPFLIIGFKQMGKRFLVRGIFGMALFSVMLAVFHHVEAVTHEELLAVVFGGVLLGAGVGLVLRYGGCLDGTEIVALLVSKKTNASVGQVILMINVVIYAVAGILFGWDRALYSLLTYFITFKVIDMVEAGMDQGKSLMIITENGRELAEEIYRKMGRTCTLMEGEGLVSGDKDVLYCVVTRLELSDAKEIIQNADHSAFVTVTDIAEILGQHIKKKSPKVMKEISEDPS
ncbi:MAG TPA: YitT family protein [Firmicutes bacterium]|nr:YitT family protein [Bacillota bacterium]